MEIHDNEDDLIKALNDMAFNSGSYLEALDRSRPYNGQPHTNLGERGKQEISGLTMRDVRDAFVRGFFLASGLSHEDYPETIYDLPDEFDPIAVVQNASCEIEKMMGIYPNIPEMK